MSALTHMFCHIDDFCKGFEPSSSSICSPAERACGARLRRRKPTLALSEIMTLLAPFHQSGYCTFKVYSTEHVRRHLEGHFPGLVSYGRFVELVPRRLHGCASSAAWHCACGSGKPDAAAWRPAPSSA